MDNTDKNRAVAYKVLAFEAVVLVMLAILLRLAMGMEAAASVIIGGLAHIVPNAYFAKYAFRHSAAESPELALRWFYFGEVIKIIATVLVFTMGILLFKQLNMAVLFMTYIALIILNLWGNSVLMRD